LEVEKKTKVALEQVAFGTAELIVGSESMLVNCPILRKLIHTSKDFIIPNALMLECSFQINGEESTLRMGSTTTVVSTAHLLEVLQIFSVEVVERSISYIDIEPPREVEPAVEVVPPLTRDWSDEVTNNEY